MSNAVKKYYNQDYVYAGPELGPLAGLMVGPEQGGWQVDELTVVSSRTGHVDRYFPLAVLCSAVVLF